MSAEKNTLWVESFRPDTLDGYIGNEHIIEKAKRYIEQNDIPHLLFYGPAGTGKTTLAKILANGIDASVMYINASDENSVDTVRDKISRFAGSVGFQTWKVIILDEADYLTQNGQAALRNIMEKYSQTTRFILTCNYVNKIIDPIQSRCQVFGVTPPNKQEVAKRLVKILDEQGIEYSKDLSEIAALINNNYPDVRRVINSAQQSIIDNKMVISDSTFVQANYMTEVLDILKTKKSTKTDFAAIRKIIADSKVKDFQPLYEFLFSKLDEFAQGHIAGVILVISEAQYKAAHVVDQEINAMAMFVSLMQELYTS